MKAIIFLCCCILYLSPIICAQYSQGYAHKIIPGYERFSQNTVISQLFQMLRSALKQGHPEQNLPPLDPYDSEAFEFRMRNNIFNFDANITKARFTGLSEFQILKSDFNKTEISIDLEVLFPSLTIYSERYQMNGTLYGFLPVRGRGALMLTVNNLKIWGKAWLQLSENEHSILVRQFDCTIFTIDSANSAIQFDEIIDDVLNQMIEDVLEIYLNRFNKAITKIYGDRIITSFNNYLDNFDSWRFLSLILN